MDGEQFMFPASFAQQRLWILDQMVPGNNFYNLSAPMRLTFNVNSLVLKKSINEIVRRHETLRTKFTSVDGQPYQVVSTSLEVDLSYHDLSHLKSTERDATVQHLINADARQPYDLEKGPLLRTMLIKCGTEDYIFLLSMHHIISDGWSRFIFFRELTSLYDLFIQGKSSNLPELQIQYADFAVWQRDYLKGEVLEKHIDYWKRKLNDMQALNLPIDKARPQLQSFAGSFELLEFSPDLSNALRNLGVRENVTLFMVLFTGFVVLLHRYSQQDDIAVGVPVANRNHTELEHLIGFFVNSILIRTDLSGRPTFADLLQRVKSVTLEAYKHEDLPFEMLVEAMQPERDLSRNPLFQVSFQFLQFPTISESGFDTGSPFPGVDKGTSIFDLRVSFAEYNDRIGGEIEYSTQLFETTTIRNISANFIRLMTKVVEDPLLPIDEIEILKEDEKEYLLKKWNSTDKEFNCTLLLHHLFEEQAILFPDNVAVIFRNAKITFKELNEKSNQLAHYLQSRGINPGSIVGVYLERSEKMIIAFLAILKMGAAYVPMERHNPKSRLQLVIDDVGMQAIVVQQRNSELLSSYTGHVISLEEEWEQIAEEKNTNLEVPVHDSSIAYVIYTSGSTGKPKGVMIPHSAICNHMLWMKEQFPLEPDDVVMQRTPAGFDASVWEFYAPLITGSQLYIAEEVGSNDPDYLIEKIIHYSVRILQVVPSLLRLLLEHPRFNECISLKRVYCGGEALHPRYVHSFYQLSDAKLYNLYGPTEVTIDASCWHCKVEKERERVSIGKPISNLRYYVLDELMNPVPAGVLGELWIGGAGLALGYVGNPSLTAVKFLPDPFGEKPGRRLYRTGDKVRYRADGNLEYLGRIDQQIKLRGFRIEIGDVESTLRSHKQVKDALVVYKQENDDQYLVAYLVPINTDMSKDESHNSFITSVIEYLTEKLPYYMVPAMIMVIDAIPLKPNGKINNSLLPEISHQRALQTASYSPPENENEMILSEIWSDLFKMERVGINDHFFTMLGGNSLMATQMISRVREHFGTKIPLQTIFKAPTIRRFERLLNEHLRSKSLSPEGSDYPTLIDI